MKKLSKVVGLTLASLGGLAVAATGLVLYKMKTDAIDLDDYEQLDDLTPSEHCKCCAKGCHCGDCPECK